ncbi:uncharacterized protein GGS22DRAFT_188789 [Annulohypoxylon maeteangense]|uniref:uncharacterized protein n=1 Tax=Annulohypoxylon maeteangense TaxID=1927788 RepID=UPI0020089B1D|nr:uncharacterized protein GGS22DRAFT_188789 [Annulohypoxylon maeteangense]KAI0884582.1 hypothetical protein GGS22DRAFT_188789 [Annulohypoxylon maeteangense]
MSQKTPSDFPRFPELPRELRNMIWQFAAPDMLPLALPTGPPVVRLPVPGCFHVNREAREEIARCTPFFIDLHHINITFKTIKRILYKMPCLQELCKYIREFVMCQCGMIYFDAKVHCPHEFPRLKKIYGLSKIFPISQLSTKYNQKGVSQIQASFDIIPLLGQSSLSVDSLYQSPIHRLTSPPTRNKPHNTTNMRFFSTIVAALAVAQGVSAVDVQKSVIVSFPSETTDDIVNRAKDDIRKAGGVITHEYQLIKGFAAKAPQKILETVSAWSSEFHAVIEEDQVVEITSNSS